MAAHTLGVVDDRRWGTGVRTGNPAVAALRGADGQRGEGTGAVAITSRQAAELLTCTAPTAAGDHLVASVTPGGAVRGFTFRVTARNLSQVV